MYKDVIVVGGGYFGCAISYYLAKNHLKTLLLEQREIGSGSSGANFGCVQVQDSEPGLSLELTLEGYKRVKALEKELNSPLDFREIGSLVAAGNDIEMKELERLAAVKAERGLNLELLSRTDLMKREPNLSVEYLAGASYCRQGNLNGFKLLHAFLNKGTEAGLEIREGCKVKSLLVDGGCCKGVELFSGERLYADQTVLSSGAWTKELCRGAGLDVPVEYVKAEGFVTEAVAPYLRNYFSLASFFTEAHGQAEATTSFCCAQTLAGNLLLGETSKPGNTAPEQADDLCSGEHCRGIAKAVRRYFPSLADVNIIRSWVTCSPYTSTMLPVFGPSPLEGLFLAAGFKSAVVLSAIAGEITADILTGRGTLYPLEQFTEQVKSFARRADLNAKIDFEK